MIQQCINCRSSKLKEIKAEVAFANGKASPVYLLQKPVVCLDCGHAEFLVPADSLTKVREIVAAEETKTDC